MASLHRNCTVNTLLDCKVESSPVLLTKFGNVRIFRIDVSSKRKSGIVDNFFLEYSSELGIVVHKGDFISVVGDIRTLNKKNSDFVIEGFIFAKSIKILDSEPEDYRNDTEITDAELYSFIDVRDSYSSEGSIVSDYRVKLSRGHGRCSYFKATSWGSDAVFLGNIHESVKYMNIKCRLQSHVSKKSGRLYLCLAVYHLDVEKPEEAKSST